MLYREWNLRLQQGEQAVELAQSAQIGPLLAKVLAARGINDAAEAENLLHADVSLPDPFSLLEMDKAVERIHRALSEEETIVVFGDYDADGITATALLYTYLASQEAEVYYKLPNRSDEGYSLTPAVVDQAAARGVRLIITVDGGTSAFEGLARAKECGIDVIVTDHHLPQETFPDAVAFVNPCRPDNETPMKILSGVGVAFMLAAALEGCPPEELLPMFGDLVAVGTVADVMKLIGVNRVLVREGLAALAEGQRPGLSALIEACGWKDKAVTAENISYGLAPRLNAAGRMDEATDALRLLLCESEEEARPLVEHLQGQNVARQKAEQDIMERIVAQVESDPEMHHARLLVVAGEGWHPGVVGIVASHLVEKYSRPVIVISLENGEGRGSGRSISGFSLHGAIAACEDLLVRFGGHDLAAGLSILPENIDEFRRRINAWADENWPVAALPERLADAAALPEELTVANVQQLEMLAPCGSGNPAPRFLLQNAQIDAVYALSEGRHCRLRLTAGGQCLYAVLFGSPPETLPYFVGDKIDVLLALSVYDSKAGQQVSGRIVEMRPAGLGNTHAAQCASFESFLLGRAVPLEEQELLSPTREDVAAVYLAIRGDKNVSALDLRPLFAQLSDMSAGRVLAALAVLEELALVQINAETHLYTAPPAPQRRDLWESSLMQKLGKR